MCRPSRPSSETPIPARTRASRELPFRSRARKPGCRLGSGSTVRQAATANCFRSGSHWRSCLAGCRHLNPLATGCLWDGSHEKHTGSAIAPLAGGGWPTQSAVRQFLTQLTHELAGHADTPDIQRFWLRRELRNHDLILKINEQILAVNAEAEQHPRYTPIHVPLRPVVHRNVREVASQVAGRPCLRRSVVSNHVDPCCGHNLAAPMRSAFNEHLTDARKVPGGCAHAARCPRRTQSIDGDVGALRRAHWSPQMLAHELGVTFAAASLEDPSEQISIGRNVAKSSTVRSVRLPQLLKERPQVRWLLARFKGVPSRRLAIGNDCARGSRIVFVEGDTRPHVEQVHDRGACPGRRLELRDHLRYEPRHVEHSV